MKKIKYVRRRQKKDEKLSKLLLASLALFFLIGFGFLSNFISIITNSSCDSCATNIVFPLILSLLSLSAAFFIILKKKLGIIFSCLAILSYIVYSIVMSVATFADQGNSLNLFLDIISVVLIFGAWIVYFLRSKKVQLALVK